MISIMIDQNRKWFKSNHKNCIIYIKLNWNKNFKNYSKMSFIIVSVKYDDTKNINNKNLLQHSNRIWFWIEADFWSYLRKKIGVNIIQILFKIF